MDVRTEAQWSIWSNWSECDACGEGQFRSQGFLKVDLSLSLIDFVYTCFILSLLTRDVPGMGIDGNSHSHYSREFWEWE